jgi:hypothetical protein
MRFLSSLILSRSGREENSTRRRTPAIGADFERVVTSR